jgi:hypothetical protein
MFKNGEHHHVIELRVVQRQTASQVSMNALPASVRSAFHLIVDANAVGDFIFRKIEERHFQAAAEIANTRALGQVRIRCAEPHFRYEVINLCIRHLLGGRFTVAR